MPLTELDYLTMPPSVGRLVKRVSALFSLCTGRWVLLRKDGGVEVTVDLSATQKMKNRESFLEYIPILCKDIRSLREEVFLILLY